MVTTVRSSSGTVGSADYPLDVSVFDEAMAADGTPREPYAEVIATLMGCHLACLKEQVQADAASLGLTFGPGRPVAVDPVPRLIDAAEWEDLEAGLLQRARALNAFLADAYGAQRILDAGVLPRRLLETSAGYEPCMRGLLDSETPAATVAGFDLIRDATGKLLVLEDNLRMPSGSAYATAVRGVVEPALDMAVRPRSLDGYTDILDGALRDASPQGGSGEVSAAILSDGPRSGAWFEHRELGRALGIPIVSPAELETARGRLFVRIDRTPRKLDVLYRRLDQDRLSDGGGLTALGELLVEPLRSGRLRCVNAFGTGVADDKLAHAYADHMVRFYLGEEPLLGAVQTFDLSEEEDRASAMERLDELVIKPRNGFGGRGVTIMPRATETERRHVIELLRQSPERFVAQETIPLSTHPTICGGELQPRHVDLRPFVISDRHGARAMPGGLTRFAPRAGEMIVNSSRGGGVKDTWVLGPQASGGAR